MSTYLSLYLSLHLSIYLYLYRGVARAGLRHTERAFCFGGWGLQGRGSHTYIIHTYMYMYIYTPLRRTLQ